MNEMIFLKNIIIMVYDISKITLLEDICYEVIKTISRKKERKTIITTSRTKSDIVTFGRVTLKRCIVSLFFHLFILFFFFFFSFIRSYFYKRQKVGLFFLLLCVLSSFFSPSLVFFFFFSSTLHHHHEGT